MSKTLCLNHFDAEFAARTTEKDWQRILVLRDHPRFLDGIARYHEVIADHFADNAILNRVVVEQSRFQMIVYTLHLHHTFDPGDPTTGLTHSRLRNLCLAHNLASPGGVTAFLGMLMVAGFLRRQPSKLDKRVIHYIPTDKFLVIVEGWNRAILQSVDAIISEDQLALRHANSTGFGADMRERSSQILMAGWKPLAPFPEVEFFSSSHGGYMLLLCSVAQSIERGCRSEISPVSINLTSFGKRFGVSRTHLRRLLEIAFEKSMLEATPRNGTHIVLSPRTVASFLSWVASELTNYRLCALAARGARETASV